MKTGNRMPVALGLRLLKQPKAPATLIIRNIHSVPDWEHFLLRKP